ncbi:ribonuclease H family protein [Bombilactobacillus thymidiniphilus]|uniref:ribonuclease H n=1 Tax=Bombilactobacillus thymidiniphilus TaxID=2923363 RepID=A0ABY4PEU8_9LACO|nr:ribonuclease H family protein [Bombilactobacillus thymidiniphilus]UQS84160.1 ribonuclease H family protein [Bombilactobacillus thymidiniphilus]
MKKYYVVRKGRKPGIYATWAQCQAQVKGFSGAQFKSFTNLSDAKAYLNAKPAPASPLADYDFVLYTDGGTRSTGNVLGGHVKKDDKAAWAYLLQQGEQQVSASAGILGATNNQMELTAVRQGLQKLIDLKATHQSVLLISDSRYVLDAITKNWLTGWQKRGWKKADGETVANVELWQAIWQQLVQFTDLHFRWTKGHADNAGNVFVDRLLNKTMDDM